MADAKEAASKGGHPSKMQDKNQELAIDTTEHEQQKMRQAQQIPFLQSAASEADSPISAKVRGFDADRSSAVPIEPFTIDEDDEGQAIIDEEAEERAVAEFVSEIQSSVKLRKDANSKDETGEESNIKPAQEGEEEVASEQMSIDDVTDDEEGEACPDEEDEPLSQDNTEARRKVEPSAAPDDQKGADRSVKARGSGSDRRQIQSTKSETSTIRDSQSSNRAESNKEDSKKANTRSGLEDAQKSKEVHDTKESPKEKSRFQSSRPKPLLKSIEREKDDMIEPPSDIKQGEQTVEGSPCNDYMDALKKVDPEILRKALQPALDIMPARPSQDKLAPQLDSENLIKGQFARFKSHVETREVETYQPSSSLMKKQKSRRNHTGVSTCSKDSADSANSKNSDDIMNKDNETGVIAENKADQFDPKELKQIFDGWSLYRKMRISFAPVRRYQIMVDQDYKKNKVTVCAHLQNIYNTFCVRRGRPTYQMNNYFDLDKFQQKFQPVNKDDKSPTKELRRVNTLANPLSVEENTREKENYLLTKSNSTCHIPETSRSKNNRRAYANFDKELAAKMFGFRVIFSKKDMTVNAPEPDAPQSHKPLQKFVQDIVGELSNAYVQIHRYHSKQRILIPLPDSDEDDDIEEDNNYKDTASPQRSQRQSTDQALKTSALPTCVDNSLESGSSPLTKALAAANADVDKTTEVRKVKSLRKLGGEIVVLKTRHGEKQQFLKKTRNLMWHCAPPERQHSAASPSKRQGFAKQSSTMGSAYMGGTAGSPLRHNSISPKKPLGWNISSKQTPQTQVATIKILSQIRYAQPRQGCNNPPHLSGHNTMRHSSGGPGGAGNQNFNNYRRQNSYRKGQRNARGESAKGGRGQGNRQSMETINAAYRLVNQNKDTAVNSTDQNFIVNGGEKVANTDQEVAQITQGDQNPNNIVHLKDPKHIQGFGSNVVHVNVSCGQTAPENTSSLSKATKDDPKQASQAPAQTDKAEDDEDDAQTFIIQLTEEQTKQLSKGTLKLNGVPIPKDLSNLSYEQIMALLDSVNLPPANNTKQNNERKDANTDLNKNSKSKVDQNKSSILSKRTPDTSQMTNDQTYSASQTRKMQSTTMPVNGASGLGLGHKNNYHQSKMGSKMMTSNYGTVNAGSLMNGGAYNAAFNPNYSLNGQSVQHSDLLRQQQTYYAQGNTLASQLENQALNFKAGAVNPRAMENLVSLTSKNGLGASQGSTIGANGRLSNYTNYNNAPQKANRLDSASRRARGTRTQGPAATASLNSKSVTNESKSTAFQKNGVGPRQQHLRSTKTKVPSQQPSSTTATTANNVNGTSMATQEGKPGSATRNQMNTSDWDMVQSLTMHHQDVKTAQNSNMSQKQKAVTNTDQAKNKQSFVNSSKQVGPSTMDNTMASFNNSNVYYNKMHMQTLSEKLTASMNSKQGGAKSANAAGTGQAASTQESIANASNFGAISSQTAKLDTFTRATFGQMQASSKNKLYGGSLVNNGGTNQTYQRINGQELTKQPLIASQLVKQAATGKNSHLGPFNGHNQNDVAPANQSQTNLQPGPIERLRQKALAHDSEFKYGIKHSSTEQKAPTTTNAIGTQATNLTQKASLSRLDSKKQLGQSIGGIRGDKAAQNMMIMRASDGMENATSMTKQLLEGNTQHATSSRSNPKIQPTSTTISSHKTTVTARGGGHAALATTGYNHTKENMSSQGTNPSVQTSAPGASEAGKKTGAMNSFLFPDQMTSNLLAHENQLLSSFKEKNQKQPTFISGSSQFQMAAPYNSAQEPGTGNILSLPGAQGAINQRNHSDVVSTNNAANIQNINRYYKNATSGVQTKSSGGASSSMQSHSKAMGQLQTQMRHNSTSLTPHGKVNHQASKKSIDRIEMTGKAAGQPHHSANYGAKLQNNLLFNNQNGSIAATQGAAANPSQSRKSLTQAHGAPGLMYHHASTGGVANGSVQMQYYARIPPETDASPQKSITQGGGSIGNTTAALSQALHKNRLGQNTLHNNVSYTNQSSTHKRKIESALAQSAINAIQNQVGGHLGGLHIAAANQTAISSGGQMNKNSFLQFEQKAYSQPANEMQGQSPQPPQLSHKIMQAPYSNYNYHGSNLIGKKVTATGQEQFLTSTAATNGYLVKSNEFVKNEKSGSGANGKPAQLVAQSPTFLKRNTHQNISQTDPNTIGTNFSNTSNAAAAFSGGFSAGSGNTRQGAAANGNQIPLQFSSDYTMLNATPLSKNMQAAGVSKSGTTTTTSKIASGVSAKKAQVMGMMGTGAAQNAATTAVIQAAGSRHDLSAATAPNKTPTITANQIMQSATTQGLNFVPGTSSTTSQAQNQTQYH